jgi:hypothetical protein
MKHLKGLKLAFVVIIIPALWVACSQNRSPYQNRKEGYSANSANGATNAEGASVQAPPPPPAETAKLATRTDSAGPKNGFMSSSAAVENKRDTVHKFIRTADIKFRTKNVIKTTYKIEDIIKKFDGFVTYTSLNSNMDNKTVVAVSKDSSLETLYYTVENDMTLRIPNTQLDTTLKQIAQLMEYLDFRTIKAEDVALQLLANKLAQDRLNKHEERLSHDIDTKGKKLNETANAEDNLLSKQEAEDNAKLQNMGLYDQINYSTVHLSIYQRQAIQRELVPNEQNIEAYQPGIGTKLLEALKEGWSILEALLIVIFDLWPFLLLGLVGYFGYLKYKSMQKKKE